ncbi:LacI family DNA-binding transcriptional regulator [Phytoactinopolyspora endophytica]|uniref:LacI family DNA-binding transcriptional regulator n=1 Tax=Phytoactinopolyspora endophytica TaxID=1642495 RepID=UPI00197C24C7|nr:LacI family DNA-binding transcriptional regulator [Phytoactinopolyspora endophytica]
MADTTKGEKSLTLADIARLAGVSRSAASRALDRRSPTGGPAAERVREVARRFGYVPNNWAANLRRQRSGVIGVVVARLTDTVMAMLYEAIVAECNTRGMHAAVITTGDDPRVELERGRAFVAQRVDGLILTTARTDGSHPLLVELRDQEVNYALAIRTDGESSAALVDDRLGGYLATQHLVEHGHTRIAFVGGPEYASSSQQRESGYRDAMLEAGLEVAAELVHHSDFSMEAGGQAAQRLLALAHPPTAVFTANDSLAVGLMATVQRSGLRLPEDLSVVGYNDTPIAAQLAVPITSVRVPFDDLARNAVELALDATASAASSRHSRPELVQRESVARIG